LLRTEARSFEFVVTAVGTALPSITLTDAQAFFTDAGFSVI
jgi:hypothetical protein